MRYINSLLRIVKRAQRVRFENTVVKYSSEYSPTLITYPASQENTLNSLEVPEKKALKESFKHTIIHSASRIPRWAGTKKAFIEEEYVHMPQQSPFSVMHEDSIVNIPFKAKKSAFSKVKRALLKVSRIPRPKRLQPKLCISSPSGAEGLTDPGHSEGLGFFITTRIETDFFNEEDLLAIINPVIEEPETVALRFMPTLPRDEPFPFIRRFYYRPVRRQAAPIDMSVEALISTPLAGVTASDVIVEDVGVDELAQVAALSTDRCLQDVLPAQIAVEGPATVPCSIFSNRNSSKLTIKASASSSLSLSTSDDSTDDPISSAAGSSDSESDGPLNHFKRINTTKMNYPCLESWYNKIISELKHANRLDRPSVTSAPGVKGTPNQDNINDTAIDRSTLEMSEDISCSSDLELSSVPAGILCDPKSLRADNAPRVSSVVSSVRQARFKPVVEDLESSHLLSFLEMAVGVSSATSISSSSEEESPSVRAARTSRARHAVVNCRAQEFSGVSPTPHRTRRRPGYRTTTPRLPIISVADSADSSFSLDAVNIPRPRRRTVFSVEPPIRQSSPRSDQYPAPAVANSSEARLNALRSSLPDSTTTPSSNIPPTPLLYDIHISPTIYPSVSGTPRPSMIPRHVSLQRREWASVAQLVPPAPAPPMGMSLRVDP